MKVGYFPEAEQSPYWEAIKALLEPAAKLGNIEVKEEPDLVWVAADNGTVWAAFTARLVGKVLEIRCGGGTRLQDWIYEADEAFTDFGRTCNADRLELRGRKGWGRFAQRFGWVLDRFEDTSPVFKKEL